MTLDKCSANRLLPQEAAERLMGFYPTITASDPMIYAAGLVALFSRYPSHLVARAVDPVDGLPALYNFPPTMKEAKEFVEPLYQRELRAAESERRRAQQLLPAPPRDAAADRRIAEGFKKLGDTLRAAATR